jgi:hypothetical protein
VRIHTGGYGSGLAERLPASPQGLRSTELVSQLPIFRRRDQMSFLPYPSS